MKEFNFNTLRDLPVPEDWIENALRIPVREEQKAVVVPFWRRPRFIATAASIVLVSMLSIAIYLSMGSGAPVAVKPVSTEIVWTTDENGATVATEVVVVPEHNGRQDGTQGGTPSSEDPASSDPHDTATHAAGVSPSEGSTRPTAQPSATESGGQRPTMRPDATENTTPSAQATEKPAPLVELPTEVTVETYGPEEPPTAAPVFPDPPTEHLRPTQPPTEDPDPDAKYYHDAVTVRIPAGNIPAGSTLYIKVLDGHGKVLGDADLYSSQHLLTVENWGSSFVDASYVPKAYKILPQRDVYRFKIYNQNGVTVYSSRAWLNA